MPSLSSPRHLIARLAITCVAILGVQSQALAQGFPNTFADVVERVLPTVVVVQVDSSRVDDQRSLEDLFGGEAPGGTGSGFFIDDQGHIATNEHVVSIGDVITVVLHDGTEHPADVLGFDVDTDLAVLKIDPTGLNIQAVEWADSDQLRVGDWVLAVGNPLNVGITVTHGIVSALDRDLDRTNPFDQRIQTDASINSGNSGGPSFDINGRVIGVNQSIISRTGGSVGLGFMIPSNVAQKILLQLREFGEVRRGFLGITFSEMTEDLKDRLNLERTGGANLDQTGGVFVNQVFDGLPADRAGIRAGDVLLKFQGRKISQQDDFIQMVAATPPGAIVTFEVYRNGKFFDLEVELTLRERETLASNDDQGLEQLQERYGILGVAISLAERLTLGLDPNDGGFRLLTLQVSSPFFTAGLRAGDLLQEVNGVSIFNAEDILAALDKSLASGAEIIELTYLRDGEQRIAEMTLP